MMLRARQVESLIGVKHSNAVIKVENEIHAVHGLGARTGADHGTAVITVSGEAQ